MNPTFVRAANPFIGVDVVATLLNVNAVLEYLSDAARNRELTAHEPVTGTGLANICDALHNALAHQAVALGPPSLMLRKATAEAANG